MALSRPSNLNLKEISSLPFWAWHKNHREFLFASNWFYLVTFVGPMRYQIAWHMPSQKMRSDAKSNSERYNVIANRQHMKSSRIWILFGLKRLIVCRWNDFWPQYNQNTKKGYRRVCTWYDGIDHITPYGTYTISWAINWIFVCSFCLNTYSLHNTRVLPHRLYHLYWSGGFFMFMRLGLRLFQTLFVEGRVVRSHSVSSSLYFFSSLLFSLFLFFLFDFFECWHELLF